ncbi:MAG: glycogen synthase GlgA [Rhodothermales bacterium]|nr:glycogen synthase GlgA [Rhodothermales bacterium]
MNICFATSECVPFVKTGGLADVCGALPRALDRLGCNVKLFLPLYQSIRTMDHGLTYASDLGEMIVRVGMQDVGFHTWHGTIPDSNVDVYLIDCPRYFHRPTPYTSDPDEDERFILFQYAIFSVLQRYAWAPDVFHCNDWQTGLIPAIIRLNYEWDDLFRPAASVMAIHNIGYQGRFNPLTLLKARLPQEHYYPTGPFELFGSFSFLKSGLVFADLLVTVSENYAREIQTSEFGEGLQGLLASRRGELYGILNGIDVDVWNPAIDPYLTDHFSADDIEGKALNKQQLLASFGLPYREDTPVVGIVSRFADQKGFELLHPMMEPFLRAHDVQFVVLGSGEPRHERFFSWLQATFPTRVGVYIGYNERLSHLIEAGSDLFLMPSRYEPCGLNQMYSLVYGTVPVVRYTGGLADTVRDSDGEPATGNGFTFDWFTSESVYDSLVRALEAYRTPERWRTIMKRGMNADFSWEASARKYLALYEKAVDTRRMHTLK